MQPFSIHASYARYSIAGSYLLFLLQSKFFFIFFFTSAVSHNSCFYAEMWPSLRWTLGDPRLGSCADSDDEEFRVLAAPLLTTGSVHRPLQI